MRNIYYSLLSLAAMLCFASCSDDNYALQVGFEAPTELITPVDNHYIAINLENTAPTVFEWTASESKYGGVVLYEVVFDIPSGDFSNPFFSIRSSGGGSQNYLSLTSGQLVSIARDAGIGVDSEGEVKWTVIASQGGESKLTEQVNVLRLKRPAGISDIPATLFIYGNGFEADSFATAMQFKMIAEGKFEIIASLTDGNIKLCNSLQEDRTYYQLGLNNKITEADGEADITVTGTGNAYRIVVDFNLLTISYTEIQNIQMIRTWQYNLGDLVYEGNHKFSVSGIALPYFHDWGYPEERYRFWVTTNNGMEIWGSYHNDAMNGSNIPGLTAFGLQPDGTSEPEEYYNIYNLADIPSAGQNQDWTGMYKLPLGSEDKTADVIIDMSPSQDYKHSITVY